MAGETRITRTVDVGLGPDELWPLVGRSDGWASWLVDEADLQVVDGATGTVVDDGIEREVRVDRVEPGRAVTFTWWPLGDRAGSSEVTLVVLPLPAGSRLRITETRVLASAGVASTWPAGGMASVRWDVRTLVLLATAAATVAA